MNINSCRLASTTLSATSLVLMALIAGCERGNAYVPPPPPEVTVSHPAQQSVTNYKEFTGTTKAVESVDLRARVQGFLKEIHFREGGDVQEGQLLLVIEEEPYKVQLDLAKAKVEEAKAALRRAEQSKIREVAAAQLAIDEALLLLARIEESRVRTLVSRNAASREDLDRAQADLRKNAAQVDADRARLEQARADYESQLLAARAQVEQARAEVRNAEINLSYCRINAPISGRISRRLVDVGNLVGNGEATHLATIVKEDPIYAYMSVSETDVLYFREQVRYGRRVDFRKEFVPLELGLANEQGFPHKGRLDYVDPAVDPATGTLIARGTFPNPDHVIVSGLFVRVRIVLEQRPNALLVPLRAVQSDQVGPFVLVVDRRNIVERRDVRLGVEIGNMRVIEEGLKPDDLVVINGLQRARPGAKVKPRMVATPSEGVAKSTSSGDDAKSSPTKAAPEATKTSSP